MKIRTELELENCMFQIWGKIIISESEGRWFKVVSKEV